MAIDMKALQALLTVTEVAERFDVPARIVRREARKDPCGIPGCVKILGKFGFDPDKVEAWKPPEPGVFGVRGPRREDGRSRYRIYLNPEELEGIKGQYEIVDPRVAAKARRQARKAAKSESGEEAVDDPFADFSE